ncbi:MAG: hypothetical protein ACI3XD_03780 [Oscillospiraceae bacterium]
MNNEDKILELLTRMEADITGMKADITGIKQEQAAMRETIADMKETLDEHTVALNTLIEWADDAQVVVKIPFAKTK